MKAKIFNPSSSPSDEPVRYVNSFVSEALARQAELRPPRTAPRPMPITPTLPRMPKPKRRRV